MLVKLDQEQIVKYWDYINFALKESLPGGFGKIKDYTSQILESLLIDQMQCWFLLKEIPNDFELLACVVTKSTLDPPTQIRLFTVFSIYGYDATQLDLWREAYEKLLKYAKDTGHNCLDAYFDDPQILSVIKHFGWKTRYYGFLEV